MDDSKSPNPTDGASEETEGSLPLGKTKDKKQDIEITYHFVEDESALDSAFDLLFDEVLESLMLGEIKSAPG